VGQRRASCRYDNIYEICVKYTDSIQRGNLAARLYNAPVPAAVRLGTCAARVRVHVCVRVCVCVCVWRGACCVGARARLSLSRRVHSARSHLCGRWRGALLPMALYTHPPRPGYTYSSAVQSKQKCRDGALLPYPYHISHIHHITITTKMISLTSLMYNKYSFSLIIINIIYISSSCLLYLLYISKNHT